MCNRELSPVKIDISVRNNSYEAEFPDRLIMPSKNK